MPVHAGHRPASRILGLISLDHVPDQMNRDVLQFLALARVHFGKPVSTFPGHALGSDR